MDYLLDTDVISEMSFWRNGEKARVVEDWLSSVSNSKLYLSAMTIGEIRYGIEDPEQKGAVKNRKVFKVTRIDWLENDLVPRFAGRLLPVDHFVADKWGHIMPTYSSQKKIVDVLIASTALVHNLELVTFDKDDFIDIPNLNVTILSV